MENNLVKIENFISQKPTKESFLKLPRSVLINPEYQAWRSNARSSLAEYLLAFIIRGTSNSAISNKIFDEFYLNRKLLVTRFEDDELAKRLNYKNKKSIVGYIKKLEQEGIVITHYMPWNKSKIKIYELGYWNKDESGNHRETFYVHKKFFVSEQRKTLERLGVKL